MATTETKKPSIFINSNKYDVVIPRDRRGGTLVVGPGKAIVGPYSRCVDQKGLQPLMNAKVQDYRTAIDPLGLAAEYLRDTGDVAPATPKPRGSNPEAVTSTKQLSEPVYEGRTRSGWVEHFRSSKDEELLPLYKASVLREIADFLRVDIRGMTAKTAMLAVLREAKA